MELKKLGMSELMVSPYCLGTMTFGETTKEEDAHQQINESLNAGINFIDTAEMYPTCPIRKETSGATEEIIGNWISKNKHKRTNIILATKVVGNGFKFIREGGPVNKKVIKLAVEESLKKLKTNCNSAISIESERGQIKGEIYGIDKFITFKGSKIETLYKEIIDMGGLELLNDHN